MKRAKIFISIFSVVLFIVFSGCSGPKRKEEQNGSAWEKDMNKLIEKATPKEGGK